MEEPGSLPAEEGWQRLHPLTPVARIGRLLPALVLLALVSVVHSNVENRTAETDYLVLLTLGSAVYGYVHWMVTRWRFEGETLRIDSGLIRRDSRRLPLARIQAVDIVRPLLARLLGVSEVRVAWRVRDPPTAGSPTFRRRRRPNCEWSCWPRTTSPRSRRRATPDCRWPP